MVARQVGERTMRWTLAAAILLAIVAGSATTEAANTPLRKVTITSPGSSTDVSIRTMLMKRGLVPDQTVKLQPLGDGTAILAAFENKLTDGFVFAAPVPEIVEARGLGKIVNPMAKEVPEQVGVP